MSTHAEPDWAALARSPQFRELMASRRRFLVAGTAFYSLYFLPADASDLRTPPAGQSAVPPVCAS